MNGTIKRRLIVSAALFILFIAAVMAVSFIDVAAIGPMGTKVGLSSVNAAFRDAVGYSKTWCDVSEVLGAYPFGAALGLVIVAVIDFVKTKKVGTDMWTLAVFYAALALVYLFFELVIVNYRPVAVDGETEASFPSSHTMLALFSSVTTAHIIAGRQRKRWIKTTTAAVLAVLCVAEITARALSGVHWLTDIVAALLIGGALAVLQTAVADILKNRAAKKSGATRAQ